MLLWTLLGCAGPITNAFLEEDLVFISALPKREQVVVVVDARSQPELSEIQRNAQDVNDTVAGFLEWVDALSEIPPSTRTETSRSWGPHPIDSVPLWTWEARIVRESPGSYRWSYTLDDGSGETVDFFWGESITGYAASEGDGSFSYDVDVFNDRGYWQGWTGLLEVEFDFINDHSVSATLDTSPPVTYGYAEEDDEAVFWYETSGNYDDTTDADEHLTSAGRWRLAGGGRSDTQYTGGDIAPNIYIQTQCWDDDGTVTYEGASLNGYPFKSEGDAASCVYLDVIQP